MSAAIVAAALASCAGCFALKRDTQPLSAESISGYEPYAQFARAAHCLGGSQTWECGDACAANKDFKLYASGGDGTSDLPFYFVGYSPSLASIIVAHGGMEAQDLATALQGPYIAQAPVNLTMFPGVDEDTMVYAGFRDAHSRSADAVLAAVQETIATTGAAVLTTLGHGLGGALAEMDAAYLRLNIPYIRMNTVTFGKPRVGNAAWVDLVDANADSNARINNMRDPIPVLPAQTSTYEHPTGEIHVVQEGMWLACIANNGREDDEDAECTIQSVRRMPDYLLISHQTGPYNGIFIGSEYC
ncbi:Alpha/Beta hydrolase protein [Schizophyllum amplum]|uniref:Alpha/Beta hydrolase protein n=1 Tax=Schizophyllum amplum TaxID=97359 RepID=A0A550BX69_9AGAR|nr:Alpha/Beta hydrolase protein [Auriculariopsis ampla]